MGLPGGGAMRYPTFRFGRGSYQQEIKSVNLPQKENMVPRLKNEENKLGTNHRPNQPQGTTVNL